MNIIQYVVVSFTGDNKEIMAVFGPTLNNKIRAQEIANSMNHGASHYLTWSRAGTFSTSGEAYWGIVKRKIEIKKEWGEYSL